MGDLCWIILPFQIVLGNHYWSLYCTNTNTCRNTHTNTNTNSSRSTNTRAGESQCLGNILTSDHIWAPLTVFTCSRIAHKNMASTLRCGASAKVNIWICAEVNIWIHAKSAKVNIWIRAKVLRHRLSQHPQSGECQTTLENQVGPDCATIEFSPVENDDPLVWSTPLMIWKWKAGGGWHKA